MNNSRSTEPSTAEDAHDATIDQATPPLKRAKVEQSGVQPDSEAAVPQASAAESSKTIQKYSTSYDGLGMRMSVSAVLAGNTRDLWHRGSPSTGYARLSSPSTSSPRPDTAIAGSGSGSSKPPTIDSSEAALSPPAETAGAPATTITGEQLVRALTFAAPPPAAVTSPSSSSAAGSDAAATPQVLGNALAAVAASVNRSSSTAAAAIGSLAANISTILHANATTDSPDGTRRTSGILANPATLTQVLDQAIRLGAQQQQDRPLPQDKPEDKDEQTKEQNLPEKKPSPRVIRNEKAWKELEGLPEKRLGSFLYSPGLLLPIDPTQLNGLAEVLIPADYLTYNNPQVQNKALWGTDIYTDDSDVVSMIVHCGKYSMPFVEPDIDANDPLFTVLGAEFDKPSNKRSHKPRVQTPANIPDHDLKVTLRVMPALKAYAGTVQNNIGSRNWGGNHDGLSYYVDKVDKIKRGEAQPRGRHAIKADMGRYAYERYRTLGFPVKIRGTRHADEEEEDDDDRPVIISPAMLRKPKAKKKTTDETSSSPPAVQSVSSSSPSSSSSSAPSRRRPFRRTTAKE